MWSRAPRRRCGRRADLLDEIYLVSLLLGSHISELDREHVGRLGTFLCHGRRGRRVSINTTDSPNVNLFRNFVYDGHFISHWHWVSVEVERIRLRRFDRFWL